MTGADRSKATVVLVHGAWSTSWVWDEVRHGLADLGIRVLAPDLPGRGDSRLPLGDLYDDAAHLAAMLREVDTGMVLVGHSYGGAVMSEAVSSLDAVAHLVYVTGFCLEEGEAFMDVRLSVTDDRAMADATFRSEDRTSVMVDPDKALTVLFGEASPEAGHAAVARLGPQLVRTFFQPVSSAPWRRIPSTYVRCTRDLALPVAVQDVMGARCGRIVDLDTDHFPHLSAPQALVELIAPLATQAPVDRTEPDG